MSFFHTRKFTWMICVIGCLLAVVSVWFLPDIIPVHFVNGIANGYGGKIQIFIFPVVQIIIAFLTGRCKIKYFLSHSKTILPDILYNWMVDAILLVVLWAEIWIVYASFA